MMLIFESFTLRHTCTGRSRGSEAAEVVAEVVVAAVVAVEAGMLPAEGLVVFLTAAFPFPLAPLFLFAATGGRPGIVFVLLTTPARRNALWKVQRADETSLADEYSCAATTQQHKL